MTLSSQYRQKTIPTGKKQAWNMLTLLILIHIKFPLEIHREEAQFICLSKCWIRERRVSAQFSEDNRFYERKHTWTSEFVGHLFIDSINYRLKTFTRNACELNINRHLSRIVYEHAVWNSIMVFTVRKGQEVTQRQLGVCGRMCMSYKQTYTTRAYVGNQNT